MKQGVIPEPIEFEWDSGNNEKNFRTHGIKNEESESVFLDKDLVFSEDLKHSKQEERYQIVGISNIERVLSIIFTMRKNKIRVISARRVNTKEKRFYESNKT